MEIGFSDGSVEQYEDDSFGGGAQGEVYHSRDRASVVKLYTPDAARSAEFIRRIDILINDVNPVKGDPYWNEFFAWPEKRVVRRGTQPVIGYRMRYAGGLKMLGHYIFGKAFNRLKPEERGWFAGRIAVAIQLTIAADCLAKNGLSYPDFSDKNIMVDPFNGRMVMIDCDSLSIPGKLPPTVAGTPGYCAPEVMTRQVMVPSVLTDRHALAVLLYRWLLIRDPFDGDRVLDMDSAKDEEMRYGSRALYIEHPTDASNRSSKQTLFASSLGPELERLFRVAFVDGIHHPEKRPTPLQWQRALFNAYDRLIPCATPDCPWHSFVAIPSQNARLACPVCKKQVKQPPMIPFLYLLQHSGTSNPFEYIRNISANVPYIAGWPGKSLYQWHLRGDALRVYTTPNDVPDRTPRAIFEYDEYNKRWYLKNISSHMMYYQQANDAADAWRSCPPESAMPLQSDVLLQLGIPPVYYRAKVTMEGQP